MTHPVVSDAQWSQSVEAHLREVTSSIVPGRPDVRELSSIAPDVWLLRLSDGSRVVAKHQFFGLLTRGENFDLLQVEFEVNRALRQAGCHVPVPFGIDPEGQFIFMEYLGDRTFLDVCFGQMPLGCVSRVIAELLLIEETLATQPNWQNRVVLGGHHEDLTNRWRAVEEVALEGLGKTLRIWDAMSCFDRLATSLRTLHGLLAARPATLGTTDYQPRNVMCPAGQRIAFLELGKLGWDWTERRALQYTSPLDCARVSLTSKQSILGELGAAMPSSESRCALDMHHLFFRLILAARDPISADLELLQFPLSDEPTMMTIRRHLREASGRGTHPPFGDLIDG